MLTEQGEEGWLGLEGSFSPKQLPGQNGSLHIVQ